MKTFYDIGGIPKRYDSWGTFSIMSNEDMIKARMNNGNFRIEEENKYTIDSIVDTLTNIKTLYRLPGDTRVVFNHQRSCSAYNAANASVYCNRKTGDKMVAINIGNYDRKKK